MVNVPPDKIYSTVKTVAKVGHTFGLIKDIVMAVIATIVLLILIFVGLPWWISVVIILVIWLFVYLHYKQLQRIKRA